MKVICIYVINVTAFHPKYKTEDTSIHYVRATSEKDAVNHVSNMLTEAGWVVKGSSVKTGLLTDLTVEVV